jgi:hypothetical protein
MESKMINKSLSALGDFFFFPCTLNKQILFFQFLLSSKFKKLIFSLHIVIMLLLMLISVFFFFFFYSGNVIYALSVNGKKKKYIPFRDSKLTLLLQVNYSLLY